MRIGNNGILVGMLTAGACVAVQAAPITLAPTVNYTANRSWQDIRSASYTFADGNGNNLVDVGETVTFKVRMNKANWGVHDYDALKVWIDQSPADAPATTLFSQNFEWDFDPDDSNRTDRWWNPSTRRWEDVSYRPWTGGTKSFTFDYTFTAAGNYDLTASVMCSADLSGLYNDGWNTFDKPTNNDWNAWTQTMHGPGGSRVYQGETERYKLQVYSSVPEPSTLALFLLSLGGMAGMRFYRRRK